MKKLSIPILAAVFAGIALSATAADTRLKLADAKFKLAEGVGSDLVNYNDSEEKICFYAPGAAEWTFKSADDGKFTITVSASCDPAKNENAKFKLAIDGKDVGDEVTLKSEGQKDYDLETKLTSGEHKLLITYTNDIYKEGEYDRNLFIHGVAMKAKK